MKTSSRREKLIKAAAIGIVLSAMGGVIYAADKLLLARIKKGIQADINSLPKALQKSATNQQFDSYGIHINEGDFTNRAIQEHRHHDATDYVKQDNKKAKIEIWLFGDSWGEGIKQNEIRHKTISHELDFDHNLRIVGVSSFSPLLMHLALINRAKKTMRTPDIAVFFIDQTDIGDDYCRYRPYVFRDQNGQLTGVSNNNKLELRGGSTLNLYYKTLKQWKSGLMYLLTTRINNWISNEMGLPGVTDCHYDDLMVYQQGKSNAPNGASSKDYIRYFKRNITELCRRVKQLNPEAKIIFASHDWAQHSLSKNDPQYLPNSIGTLLSETAKTLGEGVHHIHLTAKKDYPGLTPTRIYRYPIDKFSHLNDYGVLAKRIASQTNAIYP